MSVWDRREFLRRTALGSAAAAASSVVYVTNPKPRERPVSRSLTTFASVISPNGAKASSRSSVVVAQASPPQNSLLLMVNSFTVQPTRRHAEAVLQFDPEFPEELDCTDWYRSHKLGVDSSPKRVK